MKNIILVGGYDNRFDSFFSLDANFFIIQKKGLVGERQKKLTDDIVEVVDFSISSLLKAVRVFSNNQKIDYIFSFNEESLYSTSFIAKKLNIDGMDYDFHSICSDKRLLRERLSKTKFHIPFITTENNIDAYDFLEKNGGKIILKDPKGAGSKNVFYCSNKKDIDYAWEQLEKFDGEKLVEKFIEGKLYSLETLTIKGKHIFLGSTNAYLCDNQLAEKAHIFPSMDLSVELLSELEKFCYELLDSLSHKHGPCHIEVIVSGNNIYLVEVNNRTAGAYIWLMVKESTGIDMLRETILGLYENYNYKKLYDFNISDTMTSVYLYGDFDKDKLLNAISPFLKVSMLYYEEGKEISNNRFLNIGDVKGFLVGCKKGDDDYKSWLSNIFKIMNTYSKLPDNVSY